MRNRAGVVRAVVASLAFVLSACSTLVVDRRNLEGTSWKAVSVVGRPPIDGSEPTIVFDGGLVHGSMGCNTYSSQQAPKINGGSIEIGATLRTLGRCIETGGGDAPVMAVEFAFDDALDVVNRIEFRGDHLVLSGPQGELVFERLP